MSKTTYKGLMPESIGDFIYGGGDPMELEGVEQLVEDIVQIRRAFPKSGRRYHRVVVHAIQTGNYLSVVPPSATAPAYPPADELAVMEQRDLWMSTAVLALLDDPDLAQAFEDALPVEVLTKHLTFAAEDIAEQVKDLRGESADD